MGKTAFIGHRRFFCEDIGARLFAAVEREISNGCRSFTMGVHGQFDRLALCACRRARNERPDVTIEVVITSLHSLGGDEYSDVKTVVYETEDAHYKRRITLSNRRMIDSSDTLICYVDESAYRSGAKTAMRYAERKGLKIVNLWREKRASEK